MLALLLVNAVRAADVRAKRRCRQRGCSSGDQGRSKFTRRARARAAALTSP